MENQLPIKVIKGSSIQNRIDEIQKAENTHDMMLVKGFECCDFTIEPNGTVRDNNTEEIFNTGYSQSLSKIVDDIARVLIHLSL